MFLILSIINIKIQINLDKARKLHLCLLTGILINYLKKKNWGGGLQHHILVTDMHSATS